MRCQADGKSCKVASVIENPRLYRRRPDRYMARREFPMNASDFARVIGDASNLRYNSTMSMKEVETAALKLVPKERARLAERLLESLEDLV